ncbi:Fe-S cluster assembly protein HesB [Nocardioides sp. LHG3406-4]|uniref:Fe-S cluster assembly protein HesB n=1 Tax=Nocardioides sp. LHG3406-4 TaxID=2804575 RepID=UPI003CE932F0
MLTLTENASTIVRDITSQTSQTNQSGEAGLRISMEEEPEPGFAITAAPAPEPGDATVEQDGATVYLDATCAEQLDGMVLDASIDPSGSVQFALGQRA